MKNIVQRAIAAIAAIIITTLSFGVTAEAAEGSPLIITEAAAKCGSQLDKRVSHYEALPECIQGAFMTNGVTITLMSPNEVSDSNKYMGWTWGETWEFKDGEYVRTQNAHSKIYLVSRENSDASTLLHEAGHIVDNLYGGGFPQTKQKWALSSSSEWASLYKKYKTTISGLASTGPKNVYDASEAWAELFMNICLDPAKVQREAPELYEYATGVIASFGAYGSTELPKEHKEAPDVDPQATETIEEPQPEVVYEPEQEAPVETTTETTVETTEAAGINEQADPEEQVPQMTEEKPEQVYVVLSLPEREPEDQRKEQQTEQRPMNDSVELTEEERQEILQMAAASYEADDGSERVAKGFAILATIVLVIIVAKAEKERKED